MFLVQYLFKVYGSTSLLQALRQGGGGLGGLEPPPPPRNYSEVLENGKNKRKNGENLKN